MKAASKTATAAARAAGRILASRARAGPGCSGASARGHARGRRLRRDSALASVSIGRAPNGAVLGAAWLGPPGPRPAAAAGGAAARCRATPCALAGQSSPDPAASATAWFTTFLLRQATAALPRGVGAMGTLWWAPCSRSCWGSGEQHARAAVQRGSGQRRRSRPARTQCVGWYRGRGRTRKGQNSPRARGAARGAAGTPQKGRRPRRQNRSRGACRRERGPPPGPGPAGPHTGPARGFYSRLRTKRYTTTSTAAGGSSPAPGRPPAMPAAPRKPP
jgi:hypothetical protein